MTTNPGQAYIPSTLRLLVNSKVGRFVLHFLELQIPMGLGALICYLVVRLISDSSSFAADYRPGTFLFATGDTFFLTVPVVTWMIFRGHGSRHSLEMAVAMVLPVVVIIVLGQWMAYDFLTWLLTAGYPAMSLGMLTYMLYRREHFTYRVSRVQNLMFTERSKLR